MTVAIWILFAIQIHGDHYHIFEIKFFDTRLACELKLKEIGNLPKNIGVGCIRVELPSA